MYFSDLMHNMTLDLLCTFMDLCGPVSQNVDLPKKVHNYYGPLFKVHPPVDLSLRSNPPNPCGPIFKVHPPLWTYL